MSAGSCKAAARPRRRRCSMRCRSSRSFRSSASATTACRSTIASSRGIKVTNTPDVLTDDVADVAVGLIMMTGRGFVRLNRFVQAGEWERKGPELTTKLAGRRVGILGLGRIGKAIAQRVSALGMQVAYTGATSRTCRIATCRISWRSPPSRISWWSRAPAGRPRRTSSMPTCSRRSARRGRSSTSRAARSSTSPRWSPRFRPARSRARASTSSPTSRTSRRRCSRWTTWCCCRTSAARRSETRKAMGDLCKANLDAWFTTSKVLTLIPELA